MLRHGLALLALAACGTETPRTQRPDAGLPAAPFDKYAAVEGAEAGGGNEAGMPEAGAASDASAAAAEGGAAPAPVSTALRDVAPFAIVLSVRDGSLRLESADRQTFTLKLKTDPGSLFASHATTLRDGELTHWSAERGGLEVVFSRAGAKRITARITLGSDAGPARDFAFAVPENATLFVESRAPVDAGSR